MQKYYKFAGILDKTNIVLKYLMVICFIIIATITIFKLSTGIYITDMYKEDLYTTIAESVMHYEFLTVFGCLFWLIGIRIGKYKFGSLKNYLFKIMLGLPMFYLIYLNAKFMGGLTYISMIFVFYLIIVNIIFLISQRIKDLYDVATGNIGTEEHEKELKEVDVVFTKKEVENNDIKKGRGDKKYARKR